MIRKLLSIAAALVACSGMEPGMTPGSALTTVQVSQTCMGLNETACESNTACFWMADGMGMCSMMNMDMMQMCPSNQCVDADPAATPPRMACGCMGSDDFCMRPAGTASVTCMPPPPGCATPPMNPTDAQTEAFCGCVMGANGPCHAAKDLRSLCDCN